MPSSRYIHCYQDHWEVFLNARNYHQLCVWQTVLVFESWVLFATTVTCINMCCFSSKCVHKTSFKCGQTALGGIIWLTVQFETHNPLQGLRELDRVKVSGLLQKPHSPLVDQPLCLSVKHFVGCQLCCSVKHVNAFPPTCLLCRDSRD